MNFSKKREKKTSVRGMIKQVSKHMLNDSELEGFLVVGYHGNGSDVDGYAIVDKHGSWQDAATALCACALEHVEMRLVLREAHRMLKEFDCDDNRIEEEFFLKGDKEGWNQYCQSEEAKKAGELQRQMEEERRKGEEMARAAFKRECERIGHAQSLQGKGGAE